MLVRYRNCGSPLGTFKNVAFAQDSVKAPTTLAHKAVDVVPADGSVPAGLAGALVHLHLTALPFETLAAVTRETPDIVHARASILTRACAGGGGRERERGLDLLKERIIHVIKQQTTSSLAATSVLHLLYVRLNYLS